MVTGQHGIVVITTTISLIDKFVLLPYKDKLGNLNLLDSFEVHSFL